MSTEVEDEVELSITQLEGSARSRALDKLREWATDFDWWGNVYDDVAHIGGLMGIEIFRSSISFELHCQGAGVSFDGRWGLKADAVACIKAEAPNDEELQRIALGLNNEQTYYVLTQSREGFGARIVGNSRWNRLSFEFFDAADRAAELEETENTAKLLQDFAAWIHTQLEQEYDDITDDDTLIENAEANGYRFDRDGYII